MLKLWFAVLTIVWAAAPVAAATEQEILDALVEELRGTAVSTQRMVSLHRAQFQASLQVAADEYQLQLMIARKQLAADIAAATAALAATDAPPPQARGAYVQDLSRALGRFQQAVSRAYAQWSQDCSSAYSRMQQDASETLQTTQQNLSAAQQRTTQAITGGDFADMPPVIEVSLPDLAIAPTTNEATIAELTKAINDARNTYQADIAAALAECDQALRTALDLQPGPDMDSAMRKAISKLKITCLDRHDEYAAAVRSATRKALLKALE